MAQSDAMPRQPQIPKKEPVCAYVFETLTLTIKLTLSLPSKEPQSAWWEKSKQEKEALQKAEEGERSKREEEEKQKAEDELKKRQEGRSKPGSVNTHYAKPQITITLTLTLGSSNW